MLEHVLTFEDSCKYVVDASHYGEMWMTLLHLYLFQYSSWSFVPERWHVQDISRCAGTTVDWIIKVAHLFRNPLGSIQVYIHTSGTSDRSISTPAASPRLGSIITPTNLKTLQQTLMKGEITRDYLLAYRLLKYK